MLTTHNNNIAQPALLYLVPYCIGSSMLAALLLGEMKELIFFSEEKSEEKKEKTTTTPTADQADEAMERRTDGKAATATEQPVDELHKLYPNLHAAFCNKLLDKWVQEQPNNTI